MRPALCHVLIEVAILTLAVVSHPGRIAFPAAPEALGVAADSLGAPQGLRDIIGHQIGTWDFADVLAVVASAPVLVVDLEDAVVRAAVSVAVYGGRVEGRLELRDAHPVLDVIIGEVIIPFQQLREFALPEDLGVGSSQERAQQRQRKHPHFYDPSIITQK